MSWYGNHVDSSKKLDEILDKNPSLQILLNYPDFISQLKSYSPRLLQYLTNSPHLMNQLITYLTITPADNASDQRKYKLPTLSIEVIQSQAISILSNFFKDNQQTKQKYIITLFNSLLKSNQNNTPILPLLAGYFLRINICLLNNKYKDIIDAVYEKEDNFKLLLQNCQSLSITNTLQVYLNLDLTKNSQTIPQRLTIKINTINSIMKIIEKSIKSEQGVPADVSSETSYLNNIRIENLSSVLIELLEKYYLIANGKQMIDEILNSEQHINFIFNSSLLQGSIVPDGALYQISLSLLTIVTSIVKYYSFSSFNSQEWNNPEQNKKNEVMLQSQIPILKLIQLFPKLIESLTKCETLTLYHLKIIELINTVITLNSHKLFNCIKKYQYINVLIELFFKFEKCNILGMSIQKLFLLIFRTERLINDQIKNFIFCQTKIIDLTATRYLQQQFSNKDEDIAASMANAYRRKSNFGHLMKIMKVYSGIQTTDQDIISAIMQRSQLWNKISKLVLKPYENINFKELGTYEGISESVPLQYSVKSTIGAQDSMLKKEIDSNKVIEEINRQESLTNRKSMEEKNSFEPKIEAEHFLPSPNMTVSKLRTPENDDQFFNPPTQSSPQRLPPHLSNLPADKQISESSKSDATEERTSKSPGLQKKSASYSEFLEKQRVKAQKQINKQRSRSKERALSKGKTKITSPSPTKRVNKWADNQQVKQQVKQKISLTNSNPGHTSATRIAVEPKVLPKIPHHKKGLQISSSNTSRQQLLSSNKSAQYDRKQDLQQSRKQSKSMVELQQLKNVKIIYQFDVPLKKQFRKISQQQKTLFDMIGIAYQ